uniref:non-specific serine/threonine protein kinase n=1 Tax=Tetraselmis sp. GSL018 TaxID=582737 RepID=A0A061SER0_9CHLO|mmetsp:Transcript_378/g.781  ORF Transcript_378/g.781 Transcript_378/m.781 type:complete len:529 (-) Transcript_378:109-1695(-)
MAQQRSTKDDFTFGSKIGSGSYGIVWLAVRKWDKKSYAIKEIDLADLGRKEQEECIKEVQVLAALDCPFIIKYYDSFLDKGRLYIVMEYAVGGNLHTFINKHRGDLPEDTIWRLFLQVVLALQHMHSKKILHRDLKTLNIFLDEAKNAKVGDFGVAKVLSTQTNFASTIVGTPYYLSPELCEDKPYNEKSDMWAAGVMLYEMCTRRHPFDAENQGALILKILRGKFPPVTGYSPELQDIVKRCLTQAAQKRPSADRILSLPAVQEKAAELGIPLPEPRVKSPAAAAERTSSGGGTSASKKSNAVRSTTAKKSKTVRRPVKKEGSAQGGKPGSGAVAGGAGGSIHMSVDMDPGKAAKQQAERDMAFVFGDKAETRGIERASTGVSQIHIGDGPGPNRDTSPPARAGRSAWATQSGINTAADDSEEEEEEEEEEDDIGVDSASGALRTSKLKDAVAQTKASIEAMVGTEAMERLYDLLKQRSEGDAMVGDSSSIADLSRVVFKIIPYDKAEVLSLVYKLLYLEGQLVDKD